MPFPKGYKRSAEHTARCVAARTTKWTPEMVADLVAARRAGWGWSATVERVGVNRTTCVKKLRDIGEFIPQEIRRIRWNPDLDAELLAARRSGMAGIVLEDTMGICAKTCLARLRELGEFTPMRRPNRQDAA